MRTPTFAIAAILLSNAPEPGAAATCPLLQDKEKQETAVPVPEAAKTIDQLVEALYKSVSFPPGKEPDWKMIRTLCLKNAAFVQPVRRGETIKAITTEGFIDLFKKDLERTTMRKTGFWERVANRQTMVYGNIAHCFAVFEMRTKQDAEKPLARGVDSIQLVKDGGRWWIAAITTEIERPGKPIPESLLKKK